MTRFGYGERPDPDGIERAPMDASLEDYRYGNTWNPYAMLHDMQAVVVEISQDREHIWDASDRHQMYCAATWMAASRQVIGNAMLVQAGNERKDGRIATDIQQMAARNYEQALTWLQYRETVNADADFTLTDPQVDVAVGWPQPSARQRISPDLVNATIAAAREIIYVQHPGINAVVDAPYRADFYNPYKDDVERTIHELELAFDRLTDEWAATSDPNVEPGRTIYAQLTELLEAAVELGVNKLVPRTGDPNMRLPRKKKPAPGRLAELDTTNLYRVPEPAEVERAARAASAPAPVIPLLPSFDPALLGGHADSEYDPSAAPGLAVEITPARSLPEFVSVRFTDEPAPDSAASLPEFKPGALYTGMTDSSAEAATETVGTLPPLQPMFESEAAANRDAGGSLPTFTGIAPETDTALPVFTGLAPEATPALPVFTGLDPKSPDAVASTSEAGDDEDGSLPEFRPIQ
ncbi:hypothetical protein JNJ66_05415 [Candidatus Saccharibacteria bacterium]|nr:hypothetical protein [Candidatus Saccharibacteria bacterium]